MYTLSTKRNWKQNCVRVLYLEKNTSFSIIEKEIGTSDEKLDENYDLTLRLFKQLLLQIEINECKSNCKEDGPQVFLWLVCCFFLKPVNDAVSLGLSCYHQLLLIYRRWHLIEEQLHRTVNSKWLRHLSVGNHWECSFNLFFGHVDNNRVSFIVMVISFWYLSKLDRQQVVLHRVKFTSTQTHVSKCPKPLVRT